VPFRAGERAELLRLGNLFVGRLSPRALMRIAAVGTLVVAFGLAGCGRKGGLDAPPGAVADPMMAPAPAQIGPDGQPLPPARRSPLDFLID
jgi:predicted small lipoprotein YifL